MGGSKGYKEEVRLRNGRQATNIKLLSATYLQTVSEHSGLIQLVNHHLDYVFGSFNTLENR